MRKTIMIGASLLAMASGYAAAPAMAEVMTYKADLKANSAVPPTTG
jgi:hypothetical protein